MLLWCSISVMQHLVARAQVGAPPRLRHEVDRLGGAAREDDLLVARGVDEARHLQACALEEFGGLFAQCVHAAVDVGVGLPVVVVHGAEHGLGLLRRRAVVEVDERARLLADPPLQNGKIAPDLLDTRFIYIDCIHHVGCHHRPSCPLQRKTGDRRRERPVSGRHLSPLYNRWLQVTGYKFQVSGLVSSSSARCIPVESTNLKPVT